MVIKEEKKILEKAKKTWMRWEVKADEGNLVKKNEAN